MRELREPRGIFPKVQATDQRGAVGVGACQHVEQLAGGWLIESSDDTLAEVIRSRHGGVVHGRTVANSRGAGPKTGPSHAAYQWTLAQSFQPLPVAFSGKS
jgi:hypothetical protein